MSDETTQNNQISDDSNSESVQPSPASPEPTPEVIPTDNVLIQENPVPTVSPPLIDKQSLEIDDPSPSPSLPIKDEESLNNVIDDIKTETINHAQNTPTVQETENTPTEEKTEPQPVQDETKVISTTKITSQLIDQQKIFKNILLEKLIIARQEKKRRAEDKKNKILEYARSHNRIDSQTVKKLTGLKRERIRYYLNQLEKENKLLQIGRSGPKVFYMPKN